jgi:hypothetical protein
MGQKAEALERALAVLRLLEWTGGTDAKPCCPLCHRAKVAGHKPDCPIADVLSAHPPAR